MVKGVMPGSQFRGRVLMRLTVKENKVRSLGDKTKSEAAVQGLQSAGVSGSG